MTNSETPTPTLEHSTFEPFFQAFQEDSLEEANLIGMLSIMSLLNASSNGLVTLHLHTLAFLDQQEGLIEPDTYQFEPTKYGPVSDDLHTELQLMLEAGMVSVHSKELKGNSVQECTLTEKGATIIESCEDGLSTGSAHLFAGCPYRRAAEHVSTNYPEAYTPESPLRAREPQDSSLKQTLLGFIPG